MKLVLTLFLGGIFFAGCHSSPGIIPPDSVSFSNYVKRIIEDSTNRRKEYPKPPALTKTLLGGLEQELSTDSTKYYFEQLSVARTPTDQDFTKSISYFKTHRCRYSLLALTTHWNPDTRVEALKAFYYSTMIRPLICVKGDKLKELEKEDEIALNFLVYLLESNPLFISGSENSTIHSNYITYILWNLDLITNEKLVEGKKLQEWYKNDLQYESAVMTWKQHINNNK
jgi:hypothetical protein